MLGNATTGLLLWGEGSQLKITVGRADLWDHRGGMEWTDKQNYKDITRALQADDADTINKIFACDTESISGQPNRPSVLPLGRIDLLLPGEASLKHGTLDIKTGELKVVYTHKERNMQIGMKLAMDSQIFIIELPEEDISVKSVPSWEFKREQFEELLFEPPLFMDEGAIKGWIQKLPKDPAVSVAYIKTDSTIFGATARTDKIAILRDILDSAVKNGRETLEKTNRIWWKRYWDKVPEINIPNDKLDFIYSYGLYKFACFTNPSGIPATLQGPWIEEDEFPPWSSDYHFNINVQMCYWPAYKANQTDHLKPIFDLVWSWREKLRANAKSFIGIDDGFMLPHAVDDHGTCMGGFWTGAVDHGCSAWISQMMFSYYKFTGDPEFLKDLAYPFMKGTMRVYEEMLEEKDGAYSLPVSVSPEYRGSEMNAWGRNASFQLAAIHRLCEDLIEASEIVGESPSACWKDILEKLPKVTLIGSDEDKRIALWEGTDLEESHRHHSHLAAICPFDSIDIYSEEWMKIVSNSVNHWIEKGMGLWSGWCVPWASMIHSRLGNGEMAEMLLEIWQKVFTNEGYGTLHDCNFAGLSLMGAPNFGQEEPRRERMQMDAGMGAITAVQDMLMHSRRGIIHVFPGVPSTWKNVSFNEMPVEGGFIISAKMTEGKASSVAIHYQRAGTLKIKNPYEDQQAKVIFSEGGTEFFEGRILEIPLKQGDSCRLLRNPVRD